MFFSNQFADRNFAAEKFLSVSHLIGGVAMLYLAYTRSFWPFFLAMLQGDHEKVWYRKVTVTPITDARK